MAYSFLRFYGYAEVSEAVPGMIAARKALDLDETLADAHIGMGYCLLYLNWDSHGAEREAQRALELDPDSADGWTLLGLIRLSQQRSDEAFAAGRRAVELAPFYALPSFCLSVTYSQLGQLDNAIDQFLRTLAIDPDDPNTHGVLAMVYAAVGQREKALEQCEAALALARRGTFHRLEIAAVLAQVNETAKARVLLDDIEKDWKPDGVSSFWIAAVYANLREHDAAFEWLERAFQERAAFMVFLKINAQFQGLHGDPRFERLVERIGASN
jgi:tetratricopeptide (TPR) repeat protein